MWSTKPICHLALYKKKEIANLCSKRFSLKVLGMLQRTELRTEFFSMLLETCFHVDIVRFHAIFQPHRNLS